MIHSVAALAYLAGLIDGEGTICVFPYKGHNAWHPEGYRRWRPILAIYNTNRVMLEWVAHNFGGRVSGVKRRRQWKQSYSWTIGHNKAREIIEAVRPYLIAKREQADLFIEMQDSARRYGKGGIPPCVSERRNQIAARITHLNRRGDDALESEISNEIH